jgi:hypothetical protein
LNRRGERGWEFDLPLKTPALAQDPNSDPCVDPEGYRRFVDRGEAALL